MRLRGQYRGCEGELDGISGNWREARKSVGAAESRSSVSRTRVEPDRSFNRETIGAQANYRLQLQRPPADASC